MSTETEGADWSVGWPNEPSGIWAPDPVLNALHDLFQGDGTRIKQWLDMPNEGLGGQRPAAYMHGCGDWDPEAVRVLALVREEARMTAPLYQCHGAVPKPPTYGGPMRFENCTFVGAHPSSRWLRFWLWAERKWRHT